MLAKQCKRLLNIVDGLHIQSMYSLKFPERIVRLKEIKDMI